MGNLVIVAIPDENDRVWKVSSEKIPHLTLLFLGDEAQVQNLDQIVEFVQHAADTSLKRFYLNVDRRDTLGPDEADVLFFRTKGYDLRAVRDFRSMLLKDNNIKTAYDGATQFEGPWQPHLTLGYPTAPAKEIPDDQISSFYDVSFNKIAVWTGDFEGPDFLLKDYWDDCEYDIPMDIAMSDMPPSDPSVNHTTSDLGAEFLAHYGVKGMRWGVRKTPPTAVPTSAMSHVPQRTSGKTKIKVEGGENHDAHPDAVKVAEAKAKLKKSGASALSNQELRDVANRLQLEAQVKTLAAPGGQKFVKGLLKNQGNQAVGAVAQRSRKAALGF